MLAYGYGAPRLGLEQPFIPLLVRMADYARLLDEKPDAIGIAVPGMPVGSPGMDGPEYGARRDPYEVLLVHRDGSSRVYASYKV